MDQLTMRELWRGWEVSKALLRPRCCVYLKQHELPVKNMVKGDSIRILLKQTTY